MFIIIKRNFTIAVASCISVIMPGEYQAGNSLFNSVRINEVPL